MLKGNLALCFKTNGHKTAENGHDEASSLCNFVFSLNDPKTLKTTPYYPSGRIEEYRTEEGTSLSASIARNHRKCHTNAPLACT
jgi:hypothetical protein